MNVALLMVKSDGIRKCFPLTADRVVIGRTDACDLRIPISSVSRQHCEVRVNADKSLTVHDLGSSNGTFVNDSRVQESPVHAGDYIRVGPVTFMVVVDGEPADVMDDSTIIQVPVSSRRKGGVRPVGQQPATPPAPKARPASNTAPPTASTADATEDMDDPVAALEALAAAVDEDDDQSHLPMIPDAETEKADRAKQA